jgi:hypothetical protein
MKPPSTESIYRSARRKNGVHDRPNHQFGHVTEYQRFTPFRIMCDQEPNDPALH